MEMDIASLSMSMYASSLATNVSVALLDMTMNNASKENTSMIEMIKSCDPNLGNNIDILV